MALDSSIDNVGEYYSSHYLSSFFAKDIKSLVTGWKEQGSSSIPARLKKLSQIYFKEKTLAIEEPDLNNRMNLAGFNAHLLETLGYTNRTALDIPVEGGASFVPALMQVSRYNKPWLVACESGFCLPDSSLPDGIPSEDPLSFFPQEKQLANTENGLCPGDWERLVGKVFTTEESPRWILLLAGSQVLLLDKHTWAQGRYLVFDFDDAFGRNEKTTFDHFSAFLSKQTLCPSGESDDVLHDSLEEQSHKFAHGVTDNLQIAVRQAIEDLANEWVSFRKEKNLSYTRLGAKEKPFPDGSTEITAEILKREALIYVYRLLFCFYAEARGGELGILPINDDMYKLGYSLEALRDLENIPLTPATERGTYFHQHLKILFKIIHEGFPPIEHQDFGKDTLGLDFSTSDTFAITPLTATLFDPDSLYLLDKAVFSNRCLQKVIKCLSLSTGERTKEIGRVNYAELGINQLGAVYEGLLSYKGMFADKDLIQVKPASKKWHDKKTPTWFVDADRIDEFQKEEIERINKKPRIYPKGSFILHLSGIDREQSASYYTPEVLTKCLVEEALRELLKDVQPSDADKILNLKICEPAMGSGAFLNEATRQLALRYLELKQEEINQRIEPGRFQDELRRVQHYIATRNVYGVDLNATAVELGALSLWLGSIHRLLIREGENGQVDIFKPGSTPWFGLRLRCGNSLIGAGRRVWTIDQLKKGRHFGTSSAIPRLLKPGEKRKKTEVYHFLVFDEDMIPTHKDGLMKKFDLSACDNAKNWVANEIKTKWDQEDIARAVEVSELIDRHWERYSKERQAALDMTACTASVWPVPSDAKEALEKGPSLRDQETLKAELEATSGSFQRLKMIMDTWCSLFFWPLDQTEQLPRRTGFLESARILLGDEPPADSLLSFLSSVFDFDIKSLFDAAKDEVPDTDVVSGIVSWYGVGKEIAEEQNFHHWELVFTEVLGPNAVMGGFDLILGNPPWITADWRETPVIFEIDPLLGIKNSDKKQQDDAKNILLKKRQNLSFYKKSLFSSFGASKFYTNSMLFKELSGMRGNLYKNFIIRSWNLMKISGVAGLLHPESVFDDPKGGKFRAEYYPRLASHYHFQNWLDLFKDVKKNRNFSINIFLSKKTEINIKNISNLYHPKTIEFCKRHVNDSDPIPSFKDANQKWELRGHKNRILTIDSDVLEAYSKLFGSKSVSVVQSKLLQVHSTEILSVLEKISQSSDKLKSISDDYYCTMMFNETTAKRSGLIKKQSEPYQPNDTDEVVLSMFHIYVGSPLFRTLNSESNTTLVDLENIPVDYIQQTRFKPTNIISYLSGCDLKLEAFIRSKKEPLINNHFKYVNRTRAQPSDARTLISAILPQGTMHIDSLFSIIFDDEGKMIDFAGCSHSICYDFLVRITGKDHCRHDVIGELPLLKGKYLKAIRNRTLRLNCLTQYYESLWCANVSDDINQDSWTKFDIRFENEIEESWNQVSKENWKWHCPLRTDYSRRQALLEIDVLVSLQMGLKLKEFLTIYKVHFNTVMNYELTDQYDTKGWRIPNTLRKDPGATQFRNAQKDWDKMSPLTVSWEIDNGLQTVTKTFYPPFDMVDREKDYEIAYNEFKRRYQDVKDE